MLPPPPSAVIDWEATTYVSDLSELQQSLDAVCIAIDTSANCRRAMRGSAIR